MDPCNHSKDIILVYFNDFAPGFGFETSQLVAVAQYRFEQGREAVGRVYQAADGWFSSLHFNQTWIW